MCLMMKSRRIAIFFIIAASVTFTGEKAIERAFPSDNTLDMVSIPTGKFWMGCNEEADRKCHPQEKPGHYVYVNGYSIDLFEVSVRQYKECVKAGKCSDKMVGWYDLTSFGMAPPVRSEMCNYEQKRTDDYPMNCLTWFEADEFCRWAGKRLPTEAQWERAARGDSDKRIYPWGNDPPDCSMVVHRDPRNGPGCGKYSTHNVKSKKDGVSPYGIYGLGGNVWEWTADWYDARYYDKAVTANPTGAPNGKTKTIKGGSWNGVDYFIRSSFRLGFPPQYRDFNGGFRCAK